MDELRRNTDVPDRELSAADGPGWTDVSGCGQLRPEQHVRPARPHLQRLGYLSAECILSGGDLSAVRHLSGHGNLSGYRDVSGRTHMHR
jgi:hypothetical protein